MNRVPNLEGVAVRLFLCFTLSMLTIVAALAPSSTALASAGNQNLHSQCYRGITTKVLGPEHAFFQMFAEPVLVDWQAPAGQMPAELYNLVSAAPTYNALSKASTLDRASFHENYRWALAHVSGVLHPGAQRQLRELWNQLQALNHQLETVDSSMSSAYQMNRRNGGMFFESQYPTLADWARGPGAAYDSEKMGLRTQLNGLLEQLASLESGTLKETLALNTPPTIHPTSNDVPGWTKVVDDAGVLHWQPEFTVGEKGDWLAELHKRSMTVLELSAARKDETLDNSWAGAAAAYSGTFWRVKNTAGWQALDLGDSSVSTVVKLNAAAYLPVTPGRWYNEALLEQLTAAAGADGYQIQAPYRATGEGYALFGRNGICPTRVTGLVVVYQPSFEMNMTSTTYQKNMHRLRASEAFGLGPFAFAGDGGPPEFSVDSSGDMVTIKVRSTSEKLGIVGFTVGFPGVGEP